MGKRNRIYIRTIIKNLFDDRYFITIFLALIITNIIFYYFYEASYWEFLVTEAIFFLLLAVYDRLRKSYFKVERTRLLSVEDLEKRYQRKVQDRNISNIYEKVNKLRLEGSNVWIPGDVYEYIDEESVFLKPIYKQIEGERLLEKLVEPFDDRFKELFNSQPLLWNGLKAKPISISKSDGKYIIEVVPVSFYDYFIINLSCDAKVNAGTQKSWRDILELYVLSSDAKSVFRSINEEERSPVPNPLSIMFLLVSQDGYLILPKRSGRVASEKNVFGNTVAGTIDWDYLNLISSKNEEIDILDVLQQELYEREEIGIKDLAHYILFPLAMIRNLRHLGEPGIFFIGVIKDSIDNIINQNYPRAENEYIGLVKIEDKFDLGPNEKYKLAQAINAGFGEKILKGRGIEGTVIRIGGAEKRKVIIDHRQVSSGLLIGLYSIWKFVDGLPGMRR